MDHFLSFAGEFVNTPNSHHPFPLTPYFYDLGTYLHFTSAFYPHALALHIFYLVLDTLYPCFARFAAAGCTGVEI